MKKKRSKIKKKRKNRPFLPIFLAFALALAVVLGYGITHRGDKLIEKLRETQMPDYIDEQIIPIGLSRKGIELDTVSNIVIHYVGNPNTTAQQNHDYFSNPTTTVNSHFIVGLDGEIIQCVPIYERSAASNHRNKDTISIEVCHPDDSGEFNDITKQSLTKLTAWLCEVCNLDSGDIIRHHDITGKLCPKYYVENENEWLVLVQDIDNEIKKDAN